MLRQVGMSVDVGAGTSAGEARRTRALSAGRRAQGAGRGRRIPAAQKFCAFIFRFLPAPTASSFRHHGSENLFLLGCRVTHPFFDLVDLLFIVQIDAGPCQNTRQT